MADEKWIDIVETDPNTYPPDGSKVRLELSNGDKGPATYFAKTGFSKFKFPWRAETSLAKRWHLWEWLDAAETPAPPPENDAA